LRSESLVASRTPEDRRFEYDGIVFAVGLRRDLRVEDRIIVELKSAEKLTTVQPKQLFTYLRLM
jgi:GxxExxY protein